MRLRGVRSVCNKSHDQAAPTHNQNIERERQKSVAYTRELHEALTTPRRTEETLYRPTLDMNPENAFDKPPTSDENYNCGTRAGVDGREAILGYLQTDEETKLELANVFCEMQSCHLHSRSPGTFNNTLTASEYGKHASVISPSCPPTTPSNSGSVQSLLHYTGPHGSFLSRHSRTHDHSDRDSIGAGSRRACGATGRGEGEESRGAVHADAGNASYGSNCSADNASGGFLANCSRSMICIDEQDAQMFGSCDRQADAHRPMLSLSDTKDVAGAGRRVVNTAVKPQLLQVSVWCLLRAGTVFVDLVSYCACV